MHNVLGRFSIRNDLIALFHRAASTEGLLLRCHASVGGDFANMVEDVGKDVNTFARDARHHEVMSF